MAHVALSPGSKTEKSRKTGARKGEKRCSGSASRSWIARRKLFLVAAIVTLVTTAAQAATLTVTTTADGGAGSLRKAIADAAPGDTIVFQIPKTDGFNAVTGFWTILLTGATAANKTLVIDKNLTIDGSGQKIVVRRDPAAPADFRIFEVPSGRTVTLRQLWISNGNVTAAVGDTLNRWGAGIRSFGTLVVDQCRFTGNAAESGGALVNFGGTLTVTRSTFSGNSVTAYGGAMLTTSLNLNIIERCTFNQNNAAQGGAIYNNQGGAVIRSCTIVGNTASAPIVSGNLGGGIVAINGSKGETQMENTIVVGNTSAGTAPDIAGPINSFGHNLLGSTDGNSGVTASGDQVGVTSVQVNLHSLDDFGGFTPTMPPQKGSIAIDKGKRTTERNGQLVNLDQRGLPRPVDRPDSNSPTGDTSDIGAVELGAPQTGPTFTVNTLAERNTGECTSYDCTFLDALTAANAIGDANTINFADHVRGTIFTYNLASTGVAITNPVTINGPGADLLGFSAQSIARIFRVTSSGVTFSGLRFDFGKTSDQDGGAFHNTGGLTLNNCLVNVSFANGIGNGGGVYNSSNGTLVINGCTFSGNSAGQFGGGVYSDGILSVTNSTFIANAALRGGGIISRASGGASMCTIRNCTITENQAKDGVNMPGFGGGGLFMEGGAQQYHIGNTIVAGNFSTNDPDVRGNYTSDGHNLIGNVGDATGLVNGNKGDLVGTTGSPVNAQFDTYANHGGPLFTYSLKSNSPAINAGDDALAPSTDQRGFPRVGVSDIGAFEFGSSLPMPTPTPTPTPTATPTATPPTTLANISTRLRVETGDNVLIGGFIVTGTQQKTIMVRAIGPSLAQFFSDTLSDPTLELRDGAGTLLDSNDNWISSANKQAIIDSGIAPTNDLESAIIATLPANGAGYTAIVRGAGNATGIGVVEAYDLDRSVDAKLANISTRGFVQTGNNVLIAGTIVVGSQSQNVIIRAIGPSLPITGKLDNPTLELRDGNGGLLEANDNWVDSANKQAIADTGIPPSNDLESAIIRALPPAAYTAIVRGVNDATGIAVVEVYALP